MSYNEMDYDAYWFIYSVRTLRLLCLDKLPYFSNLGIKSLIIWGGWGAIKSSRSDNMVRSQFDPERWHPIMKNTRGVVDVITDFGVQLLSNSRLFRWCWSTLRKSWERATHLNWLGVIERGGYGKVEVIYHQRQLGNFWQTNYTIHNDVLQH